MTRRGTPRQDHGDAAVASSVIAFLVAGVLFMASVVAVLVTTQTGSDSAATGDAPDSAAFQIQAKGLADLLMGSTGYAVCPTTASSSSSSTTLTCPAGAREFGAGVASTGFTGKLADADSVTRLGLLDPDSTEPGMMDFVKFQNLRLAPLARANDQYVNYEEAAATLGLGAGLDFHIRSYPSLASVDEMLAQTSKRDNNLRVAYVADSIATASGPSSPAAGLTLGPLTCTVDNVAAPKSIIISSTITNTGGAATTFEGVFDLEFSNQDTESRKKNTGVIPNDGVPVTISMQPGAIGARDCLGLKATLKLYDTDQYLLEQSTPPGGFTNTAAPSQRPARALRLDTSSMNYLDDENIVLDWKLSKDLAEHDHLIITVCPGTTECFPATNSPFYKDIVVPKKEQDRIPWTLPAALLGPAPANTLPGSLYTARLYLDSASAGAYRATQTIVVTSTALPAYAATVSVPSSAVAVEVGYLEDLMGKFCPTWYDTKTPSPSDGSPLATSQWTVASGAPDWADRCSGFKTGQPHFGDVYPQKSLRRTLEDRLMDPTKPKTSTGACSGAPRYDYTNVLVIGSNVDHNKMTSGDVKDCIQDWVLGGGTLIVLGSDQGKTEWLQSTFKVALEGSSTGINVPDTAHPVLHVPNELGWPAYQQSFSWRLKETGKFDSEAAFTRVVNEASSDPNAILAVSDPGDFQGGSVILTGWTPYDLNGPAANTPAFAEEGRKLLHNLLMLGYRDLYLDYGPALPAFSNVIPAVRGAQICHPEFDDEIATPDLCDNPIDLRMLVYVFPSTG